MTDTTAENNESHSPLATEIVEISPESLVVEQSENSSDSVSNNFEIEKNAEDSKLLGLIADLKEQIKENNRLSGERERVIDWLHEENQRLKQGELQQALLPIFRDLIRLYDDLKITADSYSEKIESSNENPVKDFVCYRETINDILYRYGVEPIETKIGEEFNSKEHKAVGTTSTGDEEQNRKISKIIRDGFRTETKIIRNVEVGVYRYIIPAVENIAEQNENTPETMESESEVI